MSETVLHTFLATASITLSPNKLRQFPAQEHAPEVPGAAVVAALCLVDGKVVSPKKVPSHPAGHQNIFLVYGTAESKGACVALEKEQQKQQQKQQQVQLQMENVQLQMEKMAEMLGEMQQRFDEGNRTQQQQIAKLQLDAEQKAKEVAAARADAASARVDAAKALADAAKAEAEVVRVRDEMKLGHDIVEQQLAEVKAAAAKAGEDARYSAWAARREFQTISAHVLHCLLGGRAPVHTEPTECTFFQQLHPSQQLYQLIDGLPGRPSGWQEGFDKIITERNASQHPPLTEAAMDKRVKDAKKLLTPNMRGAMSIAAFVLDNYSRLKAEVPNLPNSYPQRSS